MSKVLIVATGFAKATHKPIELMEEAGFSILDTGSWFNDHNVIVY